MIPSAQLAPFADPGRRPRASRPLSTMDLTEPGARDIDAASAASRRVQQAARTCCRPSCIAIRPITRWPTASTCSRLPPWSSARSRTCCAASGPIAGGYCDYQRSRTSSASCSHSPHVGRLELRADPDQPDQLGSAARRQPVRSPVRAPRVSSRLMRIVCAHRRSRENVLRHVFPRQRARARNSSGRDTTSCSSDVYADADGRGERQFASGCSSAASACICSSTIRCSASCRRSLDKLWDSKWALKLATSGSISVDPRLLGEMTVSMLRGEQGFKPRKSGS